MALTAAASNGHLDAFKYLLPINWDLYLKTYDTAHMIINIATGAVFEWIINEDLTKDMPTIAYSRLLCYRPMGPPLMKRILERLCICANLVPDCTNICGFTRKDDKLVLDDLFLAVSNRKDIQCMDLIITMVSENKDYATLQYASYLPCAEHIDLAKHVFEHTVYKNTRDHIPGGNGFPGIVVYLYLMLRSLEYDGQVFLLIASRFKQTKQFNLPLLVQGVDDHGWCRLMSTNPAVIKLCVKRGVDFASKAPALIKIADNSQNIQTLTTLFSLCGVICDKKQPWFSTLSVKIQRILIDKYKLT